MEIRKKEPTRLSEAESAYEDWKGTAVAEDSVIAGSKDLWELAGLADERERWSILGIEMDAHSHGEEPRWSIRVYVADRVELGVEKFDDWARVADEHGGIPVADILLHDLSINDVIKSMKLFGVQLRRGNMPFELLHSAYGDHPPQD